MPQTSCLLSGRRPRPCLLAGLSRPRSGLRHSYSLPLVIIIITCHIVKLRFAIGMPSFLSLDKNTVFFIESLGPVKEKWGPVKTFLREINKVY